MPSHFTQGATPARIDADMPALPFFDPEDFNPDRFAVNPNPTPFSFLPFGGGPRLCIGMQFALMEMKIVLTHLVTHFDLEVTNPQAVKMKPQNTNRQTQ